MDISDSESDILNMTTQSNSFSSIELPQSSFDYRARASILEAKKPAAKAVVANTAVFTTKTKKSKKKRTAAAAALTSASENENSEATSAYFLQIAIDNLNIAAAKETDNNIQSKIQKIASNAQQILLNETELEVEAETTNQTIQNSQINKTTDQTIQNSQINETSELQKLRTDITNKFSQTYSILSDMQAANAAKKPDISELSSQNSGKKTHAQVAAQAKTTSKIQNPPNTANAEGQESSILARSKSRTQASTKSKESQLFSTKSREKRLLLLDSQDSEIEPIKVRNLVNLELQKQLKISDPIITAITKSYRLQNIVLTTTSKYSADFLIQNEKIWSKFFKYSSCKVDTAWYKVVAHGISTEIFNDLD